ncbi:N-acylglucosamine 2-epimerase [Bordetella sp. 02P26C-1]|nr:N-acylglucosamine 2-epimerase [Bordetella sp. 02P26C-1]
MVNSLSAELSRTMSSLRRHFDDVILPMWTGSGFNSSLGLPYESLSGDVREPLPVQRYRAMACARQLYVYATARGEDYHAHAARLFDALLHYFRDVKHGGWRYSVDAEGRPLDERQDLYTHAFIVFACAAYFDRCHRADARQVMLQTAQQIEGQFRTADGTYQAAMSADWTQVMAGPAQNPIMHLTEAYLAAARVAEPAWFAQKLRRTAQEVADTFLHASALCITEAPTRAVDNAIEPGHQFEWYALLANAPEVFADLVLPVTLPRGCIWARERGVMPKSSGVCAALREDGSISDPTQRIWAQAEYARYLAVLGDWSALSIHLTQFQQRFLHAGGWHECLDSEGQLVRADMPATTPYHLATCYAALPESQ